jgi:phosphonate transport system substrate-binding protein
MIFSRTTRLCALAVAISSLSLGLIFNRNYSQVNAAPIPTPLAGGERMQLAQNSLSRLTIVFPSRSDSVDLQRKADAVSQFLAKKIGIPVVGMVADDTATVEALRANRADVAFLGNRAALKAEQLAGAKLYLAEVRDNYSGGYSYRSIFVVTKNSPLQTKSSQRQTLAQLQGKRIAFTSPTSGSGFIFPLAELVKFKLVPDRDRLNNFFSQVTYGNGYSGALQAVLRGQVDVATVSEYSLQPPYITAEEAKRLRILAAIPGVPAHGIVIDDDVPAPLRQKLIAALLLLNQPANNKLLRDLYNSTKLVKVDGTKHLAPIKRALQQAGMTP